MSNAFQIPHLAVLGKAEYHLKFCIASLFYHPVHCYKDSQDKTRSVSVHFLFLL